MGFISSDVKRLEDELEYYKRSKPQEEIRSLNRELGELRQLLAEKSKEVREWNLKYAQLMLEHQRMLQEMENKNAL